MPTEAPSPARQPATGNARGGGRGGRGGKGTGRGRGGRGGRGGGRGGNSSSATPKQTGNGTGRGSTRRGRVKNFTDPRVQAAYDRQRDLKDIFQMVANVVKPALSELCERGVDQLLQSPEAHLAYSRVVHMADELQQRFDSIVAIQDARLHKGLQLAEDCLQARNHVAEEECQNRLDDLYEQYYDGILNQLRVLSSLHAKDLPVDLRDDRFEYNVIDDDHLDHDFGPDEEYMDGHLVPYPHLVEGTRKWNKARAKGAEAAAEKEAAAAAAKGKAARGKAAAAKRKAQGQLDGQPTPKKATRVSARNANANPPPPAELSTPQPAKGLLAAAKEAAALTEANTPAAEDSNPASPEAVNALADVDIPQEQMSPKLPKNVTDADEYGVRTYVQRLPLDKIVHSRFCMPRPFSFGPDEIGFRDSTNDPSRQKKRGPNKYTGKPNSSLLHVDHRTVNYDYSTLTPDDFDQEAIQQHALHPRYGFFMSNSKNEAEPATPYVMPGKPVVYIANPSGRVVHASRSFVATINQRSVAEAPLRAQMGASVRRFCKAADIEAEHVAITDYVEPHQRLLARSLGTAERELEASPRPSAAPEEGHGEEHERPRDGTTAGEEADEEMEDAGEAAAAAADNGDGEGAHEQPDGAISSLSVLTYAMAFAEAKEATRATPSVSKTSQYDAIRDVFTSARPVPVPAPDDDAVDLNLNFLAQVCNVQPRKPGAESDDAPQPAGIQQSSDMLQGAEAAAVVSREQGGVIPVCQTMEPQPAAPFMQAAVHGSSTEPSPYSVRQDPGPQPPHPQHPHPQPPHQQPAHQQQAPLQQPLHQKPAHPQAPHHQQPPHPQPPHQQPRPAAEYPQHHAPLAPQPPAPLAPTAGHAVQDQGAYYPAPGYPPPPNASHRDPHMATGRPADPVYNPRGMPAYASEAPPPAPAYGSHLFWPRQPQQGIAPVAGPPQHQYPPPPPPPHAPASSHPRIPFSQNASAEPLPPLRPPRSRNHSLVHEDMMHDPRMRHGLHTGISPYYVHAPPRPYPRPYPEPPPGPERVLPAPHHPPQQQGYMASPPPPTFASQALSPAFGNPPPPMVGQMAQSPPGTPQVAAASTLHQRATPSADAAGGKYRKLQPAPVPAHRAWSNKPELKTIFYDHKETGSSAALPNSGPTQIRGWNVNQPRKRSRQEKSDFANDREDGR